MTAGLWVDCDPKFLRVNFAISFFMKSQLHEGYEHKNLFIELRSNPPLSPMRRRFKPKDELLSSPSKPLNPLS